MKKIGIPIRFGIAISASLIAFFLTLSLFNAHISPVYSLFNGIIIAFGIYEAIKSYKLRRGSKFNYTNGFTIGIGTGFVATIVFAFFFTFYGVKIDANFFPELLGYFNDREMLVSVSTSNIEFQDASLLTPAIKTGTEAIISCLSALVIIILGMITTLMLTLIFMQFFKENRNRV